MTGDRNAAELHMLLLAEGARRYDAEVRLAGALAHIDQLEAALEEHIGALEVVEEELLLTTYQLTDDGIAVTEGGPS